MCKSPGLLADGTQIACRECSLCKARIRSDWIGRCIAESKTAKACHVINLTYGRNRHGDVLHERSVLLTYSDVQKFLKLVRRHGYPVRYFVTGEYGNEKGRAHWHIILFWQDKVPPFAGWGQAGEWVQKAEAEQRFDWVRLDDDGNPVRDSEGNPLYFWPHGFAFFQPVNQRTVQYVCYYVLKELDHEGRQYHCAQSKKPPLGQAYFEQLAERMVEAGIAPQTPEYRFPGVTRRKRAGGREVIPFWLKDRPLELYLDHFIATWADQKGDLPRPKSELVDLYEQWGRVVHDEDAVTEKAIAEWNAETRWHQRQIEHKPVKPPERTRPADYDDWWWNYIEGAKNGQERQKREDEFWRWYNQEPTGWDKDFTVGFEGRDFGKSSGDGGDQSDSGGVQVVNEWERKREGECDHSEVAGFGPSRLDRLKARYRAFHSQPGAGSAGPG